jgi:hypothetical protein
MASARVDERMEILRTKIGHGQGHGHGHDEELLLDRTPNRRTSRNVRYLLPRPKDPYS